MNSKASNGLAELEKRLWAAADQLWANSPLRPSEYSTPVLGLIFLRFADSAFIKVEAELKGKSTGRRTIGKTDYQAKGVVYIPTEARFSNLLQLPESADLGKKLNEARKAKPRMTMCLFLFIGFKNLSGGRMNPVLLVVIPFSAGRTASALLPGP